MAGAIAMNMPDLSIVISMAFAINNVRVRRLTGG